MFIAGLAIALLLAQTTQTNAAEKRSYHVMNIKLYAYNKMELKFNSVGQLRSFMNELPGTLELISYERDKSVSRPKRS